jgi:putative flippase GtrA
MTIPTDPAVLDVVIPVYNEETDLERCVRRLHAHLSGTFPYPFRITIADNASTDATLHIASALARELPGVRAAHVDQKGRGRALAAVWSASGAPVLAYMDVDLSTDLAALLPLVAPLISGHSDLAIGTRLSPGARVVRGAKREIISRSYNLLLRGTLAARFSDAQCGFKAIRKDVAARLLPLVQDTGWFFDTELLVLAERAGLRIHEVPVDWVDDPDSRVDIVATALADLRGIVRLGRALATGGLPMAQLRRQVGRSAAGTGEAAPGVPAGLAGQLARFAAVGVASTLAYLAIFAVLRPAAGAQAANLLALLVTAVANTAANRRFTFGITGLGGAGRHQLQGLLVFGLGLALTGGSLALLEALAPAAGRLAEIAVLVCANLIATGVRFLLMRAWVFGVRRNSGASRARAVRAAVGRRLHPAGDDAQARVLVGLQTPPRRSPEIRGGTNPPGAGAADADAATLPY